MAEKTALYFMVDWMAVESNSENYYALLWITSSTPHQSSFENSNRSCWIGVSLRSFMAHINR